MYRKLNNILMTESEPWLNETVMIHNLGAKEISPRLYSRPYVDRNRIDLISSMDYDPNYHIGDSVNTLIDPSLIRNRYLNNREKMSILYKALPEKFEYRNV